MSDQTASSPSENRDASKSKTSGAAKSTQPKASGAKATGLRPSSDFLAIAQNAAIAELEERLARAELGNNPALSAQVRRLEADLGAYREARNAAEFKSLDLRAALDHATAHNQALRDSPAYRLGSLLIKAASDGGALLRLPASLLAWRREARQYREDIESRIVPDGTAVEYVVTIERALEIADSHGLEQAGRWTVDQRLRAPVLARVLTELAGRARKSDPELAVRLAEEALEAEPGEGRIKRLAFLMSEAGSVVAAARLLRSAIAKGATLNASEEARAEDLFALGDIAASGLPIKRAREWVRPSGATNQRVLILSAQAYPHHWSSTAIRTHAVAATLARAGIIVDVVTAPGYPDIGAREAKERPPTRHVDGVDYHLLPPTKAQPGLNKDYVAQATRSLVSAIRRFDATTLLAPSELMHGYPAVMAAQIAGISLVLDVPRIAPLADACPTERARIVSAAEDQLLERAQLILARTPAIKARLQHASLKARVCLSEDIAPELASGDSPPVRADDGALVFGYVGHQAAEIDLDALAAILRGLVERGIDARLVIFSVGSRVKALGDQLDLAGFGARVNIIEKSPAGRRLDAAFQDMDVVVIPLSPDEEAIGSPFPIVAAVRCGKCVVAVGAENHQDLLGDAVIQAAGPATAVDVLAELARSPDLRLSQESRALAWSREHSGAEALVSAIRTL